jgi:hypothetical protein
MEAIGFETMELHAGCRNGGTLPRHRTGIVTISRGFPTLNYRRDAGYEVAPAGEENKGSHRCTARPLGA